jgi:hypothetical protein
MKIPLGPSAAVGRVALRVFVLSGSTECQHSNANL